MAGRLRPLWTPGGARSSSGARALAPALVTPALPQAWTFFEDFLMPTIGMTLWRAGTTAAPDTITHQSPLSGPVWGGTEIVGSAGLLTHIGMASTANYQGALSVTSGTSANDLMSLAFGCGNATGGALGYYSPTQSAIVQARFSLSSTTNHIGGLWLGSAIATGTDWVTDPDTTFAAAAGLCIHRSTNAYSGDGAGELVARLYDSAGVYNNSAVLVAAPVTNQMYKVEAFFDGPGLNCYVYLDGVLKATFPLTGLAAAKTFGCSIQSLALAAFARSVTVDSIYAESQNLTAAR